MFAFRRCSIFDRRMMQWGMAAAMLAAGICTISCTGKSKADKLYDEGMLFYKHRSYFSAIDRFEDALKLQPENTTILVRDADANLKIGKPEQAIKYGEMALAKNPDLDEASLIVGQANLQLALTEAKTDKISNKPILDADRLKAAAKMSSDLRKRKPDSIEATILDARIDFFSEKYDDSEKLYRMALAKEPENTNAKIGLIDLLMTRERFVEAETLARGALENTPKDTVPNPVYAGQLASSLAAQKKYEAAYLALEPYISPDNKNPQLSLYLAAGQLLLAQMQDLGRSAGEAAAIDSSLTSSTLSELKTTSNTQMTAATAIKRLGDLGTQMKGIYGNNPDSWYYRGLSYEFQMDLPKAIQHLQEATARAPEAKKYRQALALANLLSGNFAQAQQEASTLLKYNPADFDARLMVAEIKIADGSNTEATALLRVLQNERPDDPRVLSMLGKQLTQSGDPALIEEGLKYVKRLAELHQLPEQDRAAIEAVAMFMEGLGLMRQGKNEEATAKLLEAEKNLTNVVQRDPKNSQAELYLMQLSESRGDMFTALKHAQRAAAIDPEQLPSVAQVYLELGQLDAAAEIYKRMIEKNPQAIGYVLALADIDVRRDKAEDANNSLDVLIETRPKDFASYIDKSRAQALAKQPDAALKTLEDARKKLPDEPAIPVEMARIEMKRNKVQEAIDLLAGAQKAAADKLTLRRAQGGDPKELKDLTSSLANLDLELAKSELFGGLYDSAADYAAQCQQVLGQPIYPAATIAVIAQFGKKQPQAALDAIDRASSLIKGEPRATTLMRSLALAAIGKQAEAIKAIADAKAIDPDTRDFFTKMIQGTSAADLTNVAASIAMQSAMAGADIYAAAVNDQCDAALKLLPENPFVLSRKAETLRLMGEPDEALKIYERLAQVMPTSSAVPTVESEVYRAQADKARRAGDAAGEQAALAKAADAAAKAMQLVPGDKEAIGRAALALQDQKKYEEANALYRKLIEIDPDNWTAYNNLAFNLGQMNRLDEALGVAEKAQTAVDKALAGVPSNVQARQLRGMIQDTLGLIQSQKGETAKAVDLLQQAVANSPNIPDIRKHLAEAYQKAGQNDKAAEELEAIVTTVPGYSGIGEVRELLRKIKPDSAMLKPAPAGA